MRETAKKQKRRREIYNFINTGFHKDLFYIRKTLINSFKK